MDKPQSKFSIMTKKILGVILCLVLSVGGMSANENQNQNQDDWNLFIEAIIQVESSGNAKARRGNCVGAMQMMPVCVKAVNSVCKKNNNSKKFTLNDRYSIEKSKEMFNILQDEYNPTHDFRKACNLWNGGSVKVNCSGYYRRVMKVYNKLKK